MNPDQLPAVLVFARVAHYGSFTRAANELGVSPSALSQTVRTLEAKLGVRLLNRTTRRVGLTEDGASFLARVLPGLTQIGEAFEELGDARGQPRGTLRINASRLAAKLIVMPGLSEFSARYPDVCLELALADSFVDLVAGGFDAGIRLGESLAQDMIAVRVSGEQRLAVVGSPEYLRKHGTPERPEDLRDHACIGYRFPGSGALYRWEFGKDGRNVEMDVSGPVIINDNDLMTQAACQGVGLAHVMEDSVVSELESGRLVRVLADWSESFPGFYLYHPSRAQVPLKLRVFIDFLQERLAPKTKRRSRAR